MILLFWNLNNKMKVFDCVVIGGGMVGAATALSLSQLGLDVALVENHPPKSIQENDKFDLRVSAISIASQKYLEQLGAWQHVQLNRACVYKRLGVRENQAAYTEFNADQINQTHLGHILENRMLQLALWQQLTIENRVNIYCPEKLVSYSQKQDYVEVELSEHSFKTKLLIGSDGAHSQVRQLANIGLTGWDYQQSAMLINVETETPQQDITWQQFFESGPIAMLPMRGHHASLVWYNSKSEIKRLSKLDNDALLKEVERTFPRKLGKVNVVDKASFPLTRRHANQYVKNRVILVGDAAHTINPMAGQGVNLGFKDVKALQLVIGEAIGAGQSWHQPEVLANYETKRRKDNLLMMSAMDALYAGFSHPSPLVKLFRNAGLMLANRAPVLKSKALAYACGI